VYNGLSGRLQAIFYPAGACVLCNTRVKVRGQLVINKDVQSFIGRSRHRRQIRRFHLISHTDRASPFWVALYALNVFFLPKAVIFRSNRPLFLGHLVQSATDHLALSRSKVEYCYILRLTKWLTWQGANLISECLGDCKFVQEFPHYGSAFYGMCNILCLPSYLYRCLKLMYGAYRLMRITL
jgi:hypothetical protein